MIAARRHSRRRASSWLLAGLVVASLWATTPPASADGYDGVCTDDLGVTVVVDHQDLGGGVLVRCAPGFPDGGTGLDALLLAGFTPAGTLKEGASFVCRIGDRPAADEVLTVGGQTYRESCVVTPPDWAFWSYWHASPGGEWTQSGMGAARQVEPGGIEGWSFSLGHATDSNPPPGFDPATTDEAPSPAQEPGAPAPDTPTPGEDGSMAAVSVAGVALLAGAAGLVWWRRRAAS